MNPIKKTMMWGRHKLTLETGATDEVRLHVGARRPQVREHLLDEESRRIDVRCVGEQADEGDDE